MRFGSRFLLLALLMAVCRLSFAQNAMVLSKASLPELLQQAKKEGRPVLFMGYASWCSHCNNMKATVLTDPSVAGFYNTHFICAGQDMEKEGRPVQQQFGIYRFPTFLFLDADGRTLYRMAGEFDAQSFLEHGKNALNPDKQLPTLRRRFEADVRNGKACLDYIMALRLGWMNTETAAKKYFAAVSTDSLLTENSWRIFANGITDIASTEFRFALAHQKEYAAIASPERVKRKILAATYETLSKLALAKDSATYFSKRAIVAATAIPAVDSLLFTLDLELYENTQNWAAYQRQSQRLADVYAATDYHQLKALAENYLQHITDPQALLKAAAWAEKSLVLWENVQTAITAAKVYQKLNDLANARRLAEKAKSITVKNGGSLAEVEKLLASLQ